MLKTFFNREFLNNGVNLGLRLGRFLLLAFLSLGFGLPQVNACSLALVVAMDGSSSVDSNEHSQQLQGLADALGHPDVVEAIAAVGGIWFSSFEWSGRYQQRIQVGWRFLKEPKEIEAAAAQLARSGRSFVEFPTALGYALGYAAVQLQKVPEPCARKVIDVAGDGINNEGFGPSSAYRAFPFADVTVNGLAIKGADPDPVSYYRDKVIHGPGAFVEVAQGFDDYANAMKRKLLREIRMNYFSELKPHETASAYRPPKPASSILR